MNPFTFLLSRVFRRRLAFFLACLLGATTLSAVEFTYTVANGEATVTGLSGEIEAELAIPSELGGYPVTAIGANAFSMMYGNYLITSVVLPKNVKRIGMAAFGGCDNLASVSLPEGLVDIGAHAFANCYALTSVNFPSTLKTLGASAFLGCAMTTVTLPEGLTAIGNDAFRECSALTSVDFPASVTEIGDNLFYNCTQLPVDERGVRYEGPNKRVLIGTTIEAPVSGELVVPASVRSIQPNAFCWTSALTSVTLPEGLTTIGANAFNACAGLTSVSLPDTLTAIGVDAFTGCNALPTDEQGNQYESAERKMLIRFQAKSQHFDLPETVRYVHSKAFNYSIVQSVTLHERVTVLGAEAFSGTSISSITLPTGIIRVAPGLFYNCDRLQEVTLLGNITTIGDHAFYGCSNLSTIALPESVTTIEGWAFYGCGLRAITLSASVTAIGYEAFAYCDACILTFQGLPPEANDKAFYSGQQGVYQPAYTSAWEAVIEEDGTWKGLPVSCYKAPEELQWPTSVANGEVTILGVPADLVGSELIIPATLDSLPVTAIGASAFAGHDRLTSLTLPASITTLHADAFLGAAELSIKVNPANAYYTSHAGFLFNKELTRLIAAPSARGEGCLLPESVQEIAPYAFRGCANLLKLTLPSGLTTLPEGLFYGCSNLKSLVIPAGVTTIESAVFTGCYLYTLEFLGPPPTEVALNEYGDLLASQAEGIYHAEHAAAWQAAADEMGIWHGVNFCYIKSALLTGYIRYDGLEITDLPQTYAGALEVPAFLGGFPVVAIGTEAFDGCQALTSVKLPESVTEIGSNAFKGCAALESITLPAGVTVIDYGLFWGCTALTEIELPASLRTIGGSAFEESAVTRFTFNGPPPNVYDNAFPTGATGVYPATYASAWEAVIEDGSWMGLAMVRGEGTGELPSVSGDPDADVVQAEDGTITIRPSEGVTEVVVAIPDGVSAASVTVEVSTAVESVTANGAQLKVVKIDGSTRHDITPYLVIPEPVSGKVNLLEAEVLPAIAKEALDLSAGATFTPATLTPITTANTKPGLTYTLLEGATLNALSPTKSTLGNGLPWEPEVSQTGSSAFYRIRVSIR